MSGTSTSIFILHTLAIVGGIRPFSSDKQSKQVNPAHYENDIVGFFVLFTVRHDTNDS